MLSALWSFALLLLLVPSTTGSDVIFVIEDTNRAMMVTASRIIVDVMVNSSNVNFDVVLTSSSYRTMFDGLKNSTLTDFSGVFNSVTIPPIEFNEPYNIEVLLTRAASRIEDDCDNAIVLFTNGISSDVDDIPDVGDRRLIIMAPSNSLNDPVKKTICDNKRTMLVQPRDVSTLIQSVASRRMCYSTEPINTCLFKEDKCIWQDSPAVKWICVIIIISMITVSHFGMWRKLLDLSEHRSLTSVIFFHIILNAVLILDIGDDMNIWMCWKKVTVNNTQQVVINSSPQTYIYACTHSHMSSVVVSDPEACTYRMKNNLGGPCHIEDLLCYIDKTTRFTRVKSSFSDGTEVSCTECAIPENETYWRYPLDHSKRTSGEEKYTHVDLEVAAYMLCGMSIGVDFYILMKYFYKWLLWVGNDPQRGETLQHMRNEQNNEDVESNIPPMYDDTQLPEYIDYLPPSDDPPPNNEIDDDIDSIISEPPPNYIQRHDGGITV